nr:MAG TPA: hypothetical protein [Bacteriophage sp.]
MRSPAIHCVGVAKFCTEKQRHGKDSPCVAMAWRCSAWQRNC